MRISGIDKWNSLVDFEDAICSVELTKEDRIELHTAYLHHAHINHAQLHEDWSNCDFDKIVVKATVRHGKRRDTFEWMGMHDSEDRIKFCVPSYFKMQCVEFVRNNLSMGR